jgi:hypothetical protein
MSKKSLLGGFLLKNGFLSSVYIFRCDRCDGGKMINDKKLKWIKVRDISVKETAISRPECFSGRSGRREIPPLREGEFSFSLRRPSAEKREKGEVERKLWLV